MTISEQRKRVWWHWVATLAVAILLACNGKDPSGPTVGSETHFLMNCDSSCPEGTFCLCGACSTGCSDATECTALSPGAQCVVTAPRVAEGRCAPFAETAMCDLPCLVDGDCESLGAGFDCQSGFCRSDGTSTVTTTITSDAGTADNCQPTPPPPAANEVLVLGDSLIELSSFAAQLEQSATAAGDLAQGDHFRVHASSLMSFLAEGVLSISAQYSTARQEGTARIVVMDGGETDVLNDVCPSPVTEQCDAIQAAAKGAQQLLTQMADDGVEHVVYFFYPDPIGNDAVKERLDVLRPVIENVCGQVPIACHWIDLRPAFAGHPDYLASDGLVFSDAGAAVCAENVWQRLQQRCVVP